MVTYTDQINRRVNISENPQRIVSLVPSQTELLAGLGLNNRVVGITKFCVHPAEWLKQKKVVGGTKQIHYDRIVELEPDLILANKEENTQEIVETLAKDFPVWVSDIFNLNDALDMIGKVGAITQTQTKAEEFTDNIRSSFNQLQQTIEKTALYLIWRKPYMAAGVNTFVNDMLRRCGFANVLPPHSRYPELSVEDIESLQPKVVLLSSEPYPFKEKHIAELQQLLPKAEIRLVDGEMFSWYGSRLQYAPAYFKSLMY